LWRDVGEVSTRLESGIARTRREYGVKAVHRQLVLQRLARAAIDLRSAASCAARAANETGSDEASLGMYAAQRALVQAHRALDDLERADRDERVCDAFGTGKLPPAAGHPRSNAVPESAS
jgi:hypothetical protein